LAPTSKKTACFHITKISQENYRRFLRMKQIESIYPGVETSSYWILYPVGRSLQV